MLNVNDVTNTLNVNNTATLRSTVRSLLFNQFTREYL